VSTNEWDVNMDSQLATHASGFTVRVDGNPRSPTGVSPNNVPAGMNVAEQARLLRIGMDLIAKGAVSKPKRPAVKPARRVLAENHKPKRPVLSLKK